jgi:mono/diheme cytochrome c family protein
MPCATFSIRECVVFAANKLIQAARLALVVFLLGALLFLSATRAETGPGRTPPAVALAATAVPTRDRLAAPPTVPAPTQADEGAQLYWLHCQPCHGDLGQGLTDEWRAQYPPEHQNCWQSGCHGRNPYESGFTIPTMVPAVTGAGTLARFSTLGQLYDYLWLSMPRQAPGSLAEEEYLAITAFLASAHGRGPASRLNSTNVYHLPFALEQVTPAVPRPVIDAAQPVKLPGFVVLALFVGPAILLSAGLYWLRSRRRGKL